MSPTCTQSATQQKMAHAIESMREEIQELKANIDLIKKDIRVVEELDEPSSAQQRNLGRWCKNLEKYEAKLEELRKEERKLLPPPAQGESYSLWWFDNCLICELLITKDSRSIVRKYEVCAAQ